MALALAVISVPAWLVPVLIQIESIRAKTYFKPSYALVRGLFHQLAALPAVLAALALWGVLPGGLLWLAAGAVFSMLVAILNAWVLLVEILR
ncbi:MAG: hypothetical protein WDM77_10545 [Steroidobacteraceae bacterium]